MLEVRNLHAYYGKSHILQGINLHVDEGEIVSLLGRNGVGRSTVVRSIMGHVVANGSVRFHGREMLGLKPFHIARAGIGYVPESRDIFPRLTVLQNLVLGEKTGGKGTPWTIADMFRIFPLLEERADSLADVMSGGEQQMLTLCRTLMGNPSLVMIDEPTEGLAPRVVEQVGDLLAEITRRGIAILLVEQKLEIALRISQRVYVLGHGQVVHETSPDALLQNKSVCEEWLGV
jgi:branched-chain amino acid transport system ATP-binding protein